MEEKAARTKPARPEAPGLMGLGCSSDVVLANSYPSWGSRGSFILAKRKSFELEAARIGSLLDIFASSPNDQIGFSSTIGTFATRLSAQPLSQATHRKVTNMAVNTTPRLALMSSQTYSSAGLLREKR